MYYGLLSAELRLVTDFNCVQSHCDCVMEDNRRKRETMVKLQKTYRRQQQQQPEDSRQPFPFNYFSLESILVLMCVTAILLILPLILPPLAPPPLVLLLLPLGMVFVLLALAFMPSDLQDVAASPI